MNQLMALVLTTLTHASIVTCRLNRQLYWFLKIDYFLEQLRFTAKLSGRYKNCPHSSFPHTCTVSHIISDSIIPPQKKSCTFVALNEPAWQCRRYKKHCFGRWVRKTPLEEGIAIYSSFLAWRIPCIKEPGRLTSVGLCRVGHDWSDLAYKQWTYIDIIATQYP